jgi:hypothetical protein
MRRSAPFVPRPSSFVLVLLAAVLALSPSTRAQAPAAATAAPKPAALPSAAEVLQRYRAAIGGDAAVKKHSARTELGSFEITGQGMKGDLKVVAQAPDKMHQWITLPGIGNLEQGYDGSIGWSIDPAVGPRLLEGKELDQLKFAADFYQDLHDPAKYSSMTVVSRGPFEGEDCYEVRLVRTSGFEITEFFSTKTGLMAGVKMNATMQMGSVPVTTTLGDYKLFGGVLTATMSHQKMLTLESVMTISSVSFDPVDPKTFDLPPQIAALVKQQK